MNPEGIGRVSDLETPMTLRECCEDVKDAFHLGAVKVFGNLEDKVKAYCNLSGFREKCDPGSPG